MKTDEQLVEAAQQGSEAAFGELVLRYRDRLFRFLISRCATFADAEDAIQDSFVSAYKYLHTFDPRWRFSTWLYRIAIRNAGKVADNGSPNSDTEAVDHDDPLSACIVQADRRNLWLTAREVLSQEAYAAMWLHYAEDMSQKDVARVLDKSLSWTKVTMLRSRRRLAREMQDDAIDGIGSRSYG